MKDRIINAIIDVEGGYVDDPSDSGGETNYGITVDVARAFGYTGKMIDLPKIVAFDIYVEQYWDAVRGDELEMIAPAVVNEVVDTGVVMGIYRAGTFLQRALNVLNDREKLYSDVVIDGHIGRATITALSAMIEARGVNTLVKMLNCLQGAFLIELAERREKDERFIYGWFKNRVVIPPI